MCDDTRPSDSPLDEPDATVQRLYRELHEHIANYREAKYRDPNVLDFNRAKRAHNQTALDLANAFRSTELAKRDDQ